MFLAGSTIHANLRVYEPLLTACILATCKRKGRQIMKYYQVKPQFDQKRKYPNTSNFDILIGEELYTEAEFNKLPYVYAAAFELVDIPKSKTFWSFGARFEAE